jgi:hypothetical protein
MPCSICFTQAPVSATGSSIRLRNSTLIALSLARMRFLIVARPMTNEPHLYDRVQKWGYARVRANQRTMCYAN